MPAFARSLWPWALLALSAAGGLALLVVSGPSEQRSDESIRRSDSRPEGGAGLAAPLESPAEVTVASGPSSGASDPASDGSARIRVRVIAHEGGAPLEGARVEAWEVASEETDADLPLPGLAHVEGTTDAEGRVVLAPPVPGGAVRLVASAPGFRVGEARLTATPAGEVTLGLKKGLSIEGVVVDPRGEPVAGVELRARHTARPVALTLSPSLRTALGVTDPLLAGAEEASTRTAEDGAFRLEGLSPGRYRVEVVDLGWALWIPNTPPSIGTHPPPRLVPFEAGTTNLRLVAVPVRVVHLRPVDAETHEPIVGAAWTLEVVVLEPAARSSASSYAPQMPGGGDGPGRSEEPRVLLRLDAGLPPLADAEAFLDVEGYEPLHVHAPISLPDPLPGMERAEEVPLRPLGPRGRARLAVRFAPRGGTVRVEPGEVRVTACFLDDRVLVRRSLRREADGAWTCGDLPAGDADVRVWDGTSTSGTLRATLEAGKETSLVVEMSPPTGATVVLRDAKGRRVYDADSLVFAAPGESRGMADHAAATRLRLGDRSSLARLVPLAPGTYRWTALKLGIGYATGAVTVSAGEVVHVEARLDPEGMYEQAPPVSRRPR